MIRQSRSWSAMPEEHERPAHLGAFAACLAVAAVGYLLVNLAVSRLRPPPETQLIRERWRLATTPGDPVDWLCIGDSSGLHNLAPHVITQELGGSCANLCAFATCLPLTSAWLLDRYVETHGAPRAVILSHVYDIWRREVTAGSLYFFSAMPIGWREWRRIEPSPRLTPGQLRELGFSRHVPLWGHRGALGRDVQYPWRTRLQPKPPVDETGWWPLAPSERGLPGLDSAEHFEFLADARFEVSGTNQDALEHLIASSARHGFELYLVNSGQAEEVVASPAFQAYFAHVQTWLAAAAARSPRVHYDPSVHPFPSDQMQTVDHLVRPAAEAYTRSIAAWIRANPPAGRPGG